jgi:hypothetical protein
VSEEVDNLRDIEQRLLKGDHVTTRELRASRRHYNALRRDLGLLGQRWHFAFQEANRLWMLCEDYLNARKRD